MIDVAKQYGLTVNEVNLKKKSEGSLICLVGCNAVHFGERYYRVIKKSLCI
jgi:hypothetical protein